MSGLCVCASVNDAPVHVTRTSSLEHPRLQVGRLCLIHRVAKGLARLERRRARRGDGNALASARVAALARCPSSGREHAESRNPHRLPVGQRIADRREHRVHGPVCVGAGQSSLGRHTRRQLGFIHAVIPSGTSPSSLHTMCMRQGRGYRDSGFTSSHPRTRSE